MVLSLLGDLFGGPTTTKAGSNPQWDLQAPHLSNIYGAAQDIYNQGDIGYYPGSTVAGFDPVRAQGLNLGVDAALGPQQQLAQGQTNLLSGILAGTDPGTLRAAQQAAAPINTGASNAGVLGGARANYARDAATTDAILGRQLQASSQVGQAQLNAARPGQSLADIGSTFQDHTQAGITADNARWTDQRNQPFNWLNQYRDVIGPTQAPQTTTQQETPSAFGAITGISSLLSGGLFNQGGQVPQVPTSQVAQGIYSPVDTQQVNYAGSNWQRPQPNYGWAIIDGRYQLVPANPGTATAGGGQTTPYVPPQIPTGPAVTAPTTGGDSGGSSAGGLLPSAPITGEIGSGVISGTSTDFQGNEVPYTVVTDPGHSSDTIPGYIDNTPDNVEIRDYFDSTARNEAGGVVGGRGTVVPHIIPDTPETFYSGGGDDGIGNFGTIGDFFGGIGDAIGLTNYDGSNPNAPIGGVEELAAPVPAAPTAPATPTFFNPVPGSGTLSPAEVRQREIDTSRGGVNYTSSSDQRADNEAAAAARRAEAEQVARANASGGNQIRQVNREQTANHEEVRDGLSYGYKPVLLDDGYFLVNGAGTAVRVNPRNLEQYGVDLSTVTDAQDPGPAPQAIRNQGGPISGYNQGGSVMPSWQQMKHRFGGM